MSIFQNSPTLGLQQRLALHAPVLHPCGEHLAAQPSLCPQQQLLPEGAAWQGPQPPLVWGASILGSQAGNHYHISMLGSPGTLFFFTWIHNRIWGCTLPSSWKVKLKGSYFVVGKFEIHVYFFLKKCYASSNDFLKSKLGKPHWHGEVMRTCLSTPENHENWSYLWV